MARRKFPENLDQFMPASERPNRLLQLLLPEDERKCLFREDAEREESKLVLLCQHYRIDPEKGSLFLQLARALARDFVPAFQYERAKGAKKKWKLQLLAMLAIEFEQRTSRDGDVEQINKAAKDLANKEPWKSFLGDGKDKAGSLKRQRNSFLQKAASSEECQELVGKYRAAYQSCQESSHMSLWEDELSRLTSPAGKN